MSDHHRNINRAIKFRVREEEYTILEKEASALGMTVPKMCKQLALETDIKKMRFDMNVQKDIIHELRKIGVNLNQLAYKANINESISEKSLNKIYEGVTGIWQQLK